MAETKDDFAALSKVPKLTDAEKVQAWDIMLEVFGGKKPTTPQEKAISQVILKVCEASAKLAKAGLGEMMIRATK